MNKLRYQNLFQDPILRICLVVMGACIVVLGIIFSISYHQASNRILEGSIQMAQLNVEKARGVVERHLTTIEITASSLSSTHIRSCRDENRSAQLDVEHILNSVHLHADGYTLSDDITMLSIHYSHLLDFTDYEERKAAMKSGKKPASKTKFFTRPGKAEKQ